MRHHCTAAVWAAFALIYVSSAFAEPVVLSIRAPEARAISIYGSFDGWGVGHPLARDTGGLWKATVDLPKGATEYKFLIDGEWRINPIISSIADGFEGRNNILIVR